MFSPKIVPYQPNAAVRSRRIDPKDWEKLRPRLEELYIKDDKKFEEVMQIMALNESFHASRRQYTQKFNEWGLCKKFPGQVMRSALRKRARAGNDDLPIKYRGTAIGRENLDRWQQRVPSFNPMSSPTASTPSQLNVETPQAATPESQGDALQSLGWRSPSISISNDDGATYDDNMVQIAYNEIRRSVSPQVAEYIFQPRENRSPSKGNNLAEVRWTFDRILSISMAEHELLGLSEKDWDILGRLAVNLWSLGHQRYLYYCVHIGELKYARSCLTVTANPRDFYLSTSNLAKAYMRMHRATECETLLIGGIAQIDLLHPGDPMGDDFRSLLGQLRLQQGQHSLAEQLCRQAMLRLRFALGLAHSTTWKTYYRLYNVLEALGRIDDERRLMTGFYSDIHSTLSAQVQPVLNTVLELCRTYIESWMAESKLQMLIRDQIVEGVPLGIVAKFTLILDTIVCAGFKEETSRGILQMLKDLGDLTGLQTLDIFSTTCFLIASQIQAIQHLDQISLRQEALRAIQDLRSTKILLPLWIFTFLNRALFWTRDYNWRTAEYNVIHSLEDMVIDRIHPTEAADFIQSADTGKSVPALGIAESPIIRQADLLDASLIPLA